MANPLDFYLPEQSCHALHAVGRIVVDNFFIEERLADGSSRDFHFNDCEELIHWLAGFGNEPSVTGFEIIATADDGRIVRIIASSDRCSRVRIVIEDRDRG